MPLSETPYFPANVQPAQPGDICILLGPSDSELSHLTAVQHNLQAHFSGILHQPVHFTCQRFRVDGAEKRSAMIKNLRSAMKAIDPIDLTAESLRTFQHTFWRSRLLRWLVALTDQIITFGDILNRTLKDSGADLHFEDDRWYPRMVTALEDVTSEDLEAFLLSPANPMPHHLFTATQVIVSEIEGYRQFNILDVIELDRR